MQGINHYLPLSGKHSGFQYISNHNSTLGIFLLAATVFINMAQNNWCIRVIGKNYGTYWKCYDLLVAYRLFEKMVEGH